MITLKRVEGTNIVAVEGDVTRQAVEAVVNSAEENLQGSDGVTAAVIRTGGRVIQDECNAWVQQHGPVTPGSAAVTTGGMLRASHVIHAVGPRFEDETSDPVLAAAVPAALDAAREHGFRSVAFPMLATGSRGYPPERAAGVMVGAVETWVEDNPDVLTEVRLVGFTHRQANLFAASLDHS